jgi:hypothetical protein
VTLERVERWVRLLPSQERAQPIMSIDGVWLTPEQMLSEVRAGTELGRKAQAYWETTGLGTEDEMLIERIKNRLSRYPQDKPLFITLNGKLTPRQILAEIEAGTPIGRQWIETERSYLKYLGRLKEGV